MPTALQRSRDILAQGVARLRSGIAAADRLQGETGPEIAVQPFDAANVSTPAALIKLGTSIAAARRKRANFEAAREGLSLEREKTREEIALLRARAESELRPPAGPKPAATLSTAVGDIPAGTDIQTANALLRDKGLRQSEQRARDSKKRASGLAAARATLSQINTQSERDVQLHAQQRMDAFKDLFNFAVAGSNKALIKLGIDPEAYVGTKEIPTPEPQRLALIKDARARLYNNMLARARRNVNDYYAPRRSSAQAVIDADLGFDEGPPAADAADGIIEVDDQGNPVQ